MRVGLDLDNTIVCYDEVFEKIAKKYGLVNKCWNGNKKELRDYLKKQKNGEVNWQKLQGMVYGKYMRQAVAFDGVSEFLIECKKRKIPVTIISHKTMFGHQDPERVPLRDEALLWLDKQGYFQEEKFGLSKNNVWFESTREKKLDKILELECTHFVDDLIEIFTAVNFPSGVRKYLFSSKVAMSVTDDTIFVSNLWNEISHEIFNEDVDETHV